MEKSRSRYICIEIRSGFIRGNLSRGIVNIDHGIVREWISTMGSHFASALSKQPDTMQLKPSMFGWRNKGRRPEKKSTLPIRSHQEIPAAPPISGSPYMPIMWLLLRQPVRWRHMQYWLIFNLFLWKVPIDGDQKPGTDVASVLIIPAMSPSWIPPADDS